MLLTNFVVTRDFYARRDWKALPLRLRKPEKDFQSFATTGQGHFEFYST
jgi:hypothetical protein